MCTCITSRRSLLIELYGYRCMGDLELDRYVTQPWNRVPGSHRAVRAEQSCAAHTCSIIIVLIASEIILPHGKILIS